MNKLRNKQDLQRGQVRKSEVNQTQSHVTIKYSIDPISSRISSKNMESRKKLWSGQDEDLHHKILSWSVFSFIAITCGIAEVPE